MCGIAGFVGRSTADGLERMTAVLHHRGPDDRGHYAYRTADGWTGLGSTRLAILDLTDAGHMPMSTADGRFTIVYNGELYNAPTLRRTLRNAGSHEFRSGTDTEVVLAAYRAWGPECLERFNGMYATAIWDRRESSLFLARDPLGIKPLYVAPLPGGLAFASEIKALLELEDVRANVDLTALGEYLTFLWVPEPRTFFRGVSKLPAGHYRLHGPRASETRRYWQLDMPPADHDYGSRSDQDVAVELRERFDRAVEAQMLSDAPIGAFLSAGLDSNSIVASMAAHSADPVRTFTIAVPERHRTGAYGFDDPAVARRAAERFGCRHTSLVVEPDVVDLLPRLVWHMDEPVADPAIITAFLVNRAASADVKVLLSGVGGDEVFGGYRKYLAHYLARSYQRVPRALRSGVVEPVVRRLPGLSGTRLGPTVRLLKKMVRSGSLAPIDRFLTDSTYLTEGEKSSLVHPDVWREMGGHDPWTAHRDAFHHVEGSDFLNQMLYVDMMTFMPSLNLLYNDKMSMAASVEVRVPFLDRELVEWAAAHVRPDQKIRGRTTKHILRGAMGGVVDPEILAQKKAGFGAPADLWLREDLAEMVGDLLSPERTRRRGLLQPRAVDALLKEHTEGRRDRSFQIWQLLTLELWSQRFLD